MRRFLLFSALLVLLLIALALDAGLVWRSAARPWPVPVAAGHGELMANLDLAGLTPQQATDILAWVAEDGFRWVRLRVPWNEFEPERGLYHWEVLQAALEACRRHDLRVVLLLDGAPAWAVKPEDADNPLAPPHDVRDFGRFAEAVAAGYNSLVDIYQIWDEPNIAPHWGRAWISPQSYFNLLREAANSIRRGDPEARIMLAALAPTAADEPLNRSDLWFLERLYQLGAAPYFDLVAAAGYGFDRSPLDPPAPDRLNFRRPELIHDLMARYGDATKPVWITAWGWWSPAEGETDSPWGQVDPALLPTYQAQALDLARMTWPWAGPLAWVEYTLTPARDPRRRGFALRRPTGEPTPAGRHLRRLVSPPLVLGSGRHPADNPAAAVVQGDWRFSPQAADPDQPNSVLTYAFEGRAIAVEIQRGPYWATLKAWIDEKPAALLPRDENGDAYIALYDPANRVAVVPRARDLPPGRHQLRLEASAGWGQWLLRGILVDHEPRPAPWSPWPAAAVLVLALAWTGWRWWDMARGEAGRGLARRLTAAWDALMARPLPEGWAVAAGLGLVAWLAVAPGRWWGLAALPPLVLLLAWRPWLAPMLALVTLPFYVRPRPLGPVGLPLHELVIWLGAGLGLTRHLLGRWAQRTKPQAAGLTPLSPDLPVFLLVFVGLFATLAADEAGAAWYDFRTVFLTPALFYALLTRARRERPLPLGLLADGLVLGAVLVAAVGLYGLATGQVESIEGVPRLKAVYGSPNNLALFLGRVLPLLVAVGFTGSGRRRWAYAVALPVVGAAAFLTFSRGLLLFSLPAGLLVLALAEKRLRRPVLALVGVAALAILPFITTPRLVGLFDWESGTTFWRLQLWQSAWRMFLDHPWLGVGPDNFLYAYRSRYVLPTAWQELNLSHPHNLFLDLLTRVGLFGAVPGLWMLALALPRGWALLRRWADPERVLYLGLYAGLVAGLAHGLIDNSLFLPDLAVLTLLVVAVTR
ncbi:MAG: O-antigen ligase family protein [Caldilineales bacterium]|nr:O-antigen ligase family protein [Caldilineales bacterium]